MGAPTSVINVCSGVLLNNDYIHTIWFSDQSAQLAYFAGKVVKTFSAYTYIRKSWSLKVDATMEQARTWTYLYFQNGNGKTYYYFINNIEYVNDNTVELFIEMDVMQTYLHEYTLHRCFVEREHSATDEIGDNTTRENVELGEIIVQDVYSVYQLTDLCILVQATINPRTSTADTIVKTLGSIHHGVFSGMGIYAVEMTTQDVTEWANRLIELSEWGVIDSVINMWMYPKKLVALHEDFEWGDGVICKTVSGITPFEFTTTKKNVLNDTYVPDNNKLLTYPYNFLYCTNNAGVSATYHYERFSTENCVFKISGAISPDGCVRIEPTYYKGASENYDEGITLGDFPTCAWNSDTYKLWLAQNQKSQNLAFASGLGMMVAGAGMTLFSGGVGGLAGAGTFVGGLSQIANILAQRQDMSVQPPQARGTYSASVNIANDEHTFKFYFKSITAEYARSIDNFFSMYGYATNRVKIPNRNVRENWTYCKTIGCHVSGGLCTDDLRKIQSIYDNGITFWKNGDNIGSYGLSNNCL